MLCLYSVILKGDTMIWYECWIMIITLKWQHLPDLQQGGWRSLLLKYWKKSDCLVPFLPARRPCSVLFFQWSIWYYLQRGFQTFHMKIPSNVKMIPSLRRSSENFNIRRDKGSQFHNSSKYINRVQKIVLTERTW